jgi:hypothetical protein
MVKTTYVPNTIRIPAHVVDFLHVLGFWGRTQNCQWSHSKVSRGERRKREREKEERERDESYSTNESHHGGWHDTFVSHAVQHDMTRSTSDVICLSVAPQQSA